MYRFQHIENLFGLLAIPLLAWLLYFALQQKKKIALRIGDKKLVEQLTANYSPQKFLLKFLLTIAALICIIIGAANWQQKGQPENVNRTGVDIMLVLDVSKSMLAQDIKPSRLEKAKQLLSKLIDRLPNDRVGLVLFAGRAYMQMPLTIDHAAASLYIQEASPFVVPTQGTVIAEALRMANSSYNPLEKKYKAMLLISDGEDHDKDAVKTAKTLADAGVMINTIGIGSPDGSTIIDPGTNEVKKDENGNIVISKLNEAELTQIATASNGMYIRLDNVDDAVNAVAQRLDGIEKRELTDTEYINYKSYFQWFLLAGLLLLIVEFLLSEKKYQLA